MKKIALIVVSLLFTLFSYSQSFSKILKATKLEYQDEKWVRVDEQTPVDEFVILNGWNITIGNYKFRTYGEPEKKIYDTHLAFAWDCINGNGDRCHFIMKKFKPLESSYTVYAIIYDTGIMYEYECEN